MHTAWAENMQVCSAVLNCVPASKGEVCRVTEPTIVSQDLLSCNWKGNLTLHIIPAHSSEVLVNCVINCQLFNMVGNPVLQRNGSRW